VGKPSSGGGGARPAGFTLARGLVKLPGGAIACRFFQNNSCNDQKAAHCARASGIHKHLCTFLKRDGTMCAALEDGSQVNKGGGRSVNFGIF
jgi:hypothetical protein